MTVRILENSNWVCWPEGNGWANEDAFLINDVLTYLRLRRRTRWEVKHNYVGYEPLSEDKPKKKFFS